MVLVPNPVDFPSVPARKNTLALHHVLPKSPLEYFSIGKFQNSVAVLEVLAKVAYVIIALP
jgi:hypothetical protein